MLKIKDLCVKANGKKILNNISFEIKNSSLDVLLGPNGSGKTTLAKTIMGLNQNNLKKGKIVFNSKDITFLKPEQRSKLGVGIAFQHPPKINGVKLIDFLNRISKKKHYEKYIKEELLQRQINTNFSGGEKKFSEITQVIATNPKFIIFDEVDSGVDLKNLEKIINIIKNWHSKNNSALVITHNPKVVELLKPDLIYVLLNGKIICSSNDWNKIYHTIKKYGYEKCEKCQMRKLYSN